MNNGQERLHNSVSDSLKIGLIGAGQNTCQKHIPGLQAIPGVTLQAVCNSHEESTRNVANRFGIPEQFSDWKDVVNSSDVDAIVIGTWPNLHCEITCAALEAGKHVLTEARMARNLDEAKQMLDASRQHAQLTSMVVPSPFGLKFGPYMDSLIERRFLGDLREVVVIGADDTHWDFSQHLHPRQDRELSGNNVLHLGILHETLSRWAPTTTRVMAQGKIFETERSLENSPEMAKVTVPDSLHVMTQLEGGARGIYHLSGISLFGPGHHIHLYGTEGTIKLRFDLKSGLKETLLCGRIGEDSMTPLELPAEKLGKWQVEADFIAAIRGEKPVTLNSFETAMDYMKFTEAVHQSYTQGVAVEVASL
ncbi:4-carboxy-2-hydroxymuconate-6-semialdehyde dehydrogenase [Rubinisphaera italica]|uniref:4-carboxy-2-hydroxymuconate-6-semialdehyde dehydrogenase n=1 Tax=Rubinisphaera italica TaxID=2527969 RepID=A0A5C5XKE1_9PLAN|nr:4-carboxy-2-hydroxymuconate-6-semialdehyde dehydrogenase [Rubinisphaera italica]